MRTTKEKRFNLGYDCGNVLRNVGSWKYSTEATAKNMIALLADITELERKLEICVGALEKYALPHTRLTKTYEEETWRLEPGFHDPQPAIKALASIQAAPTNPVDETESSGI